MKKILLLALAAITFVACSQQEDGNLGSSEVKSVKLSIKANALSRAAEGPLANGTKTTIHSLYVYFLDAAGDNANILSGSKAITGEDLNTIQTGGLEITGVNSSAKYVYVVANYTENGIALPSSGKLSTVKAKTVTMGAVAATGEWNYALLSNSDASNNGQISAVTADGKAEATVQIMPDLARIEVSSLVGITTGVSLPDLAIESYNLKGVYLNSYYLGFHVGGEANGSAASPDLTPASLANSVPAWAKDVYSTALTGATTYTAASGSSTNGDVWAYMLPAGDAPRVIFNLEDVVFAGGVVPAVQNRFVTVKSFTLTGGGALTEFLRGKVYRVTAVNFSANDTHENPNAKDIDVTVKVDVLGWEGIDIDPEL